MRKRCIEYAIIILLCCTIVRIWLLPTQETNTQQTACPTCPPCLCASPTPTMTPTQTATPIFTKTPVPGTSKLPPVIFVWEDWSTNVDYRAVHPGWGACGGWQVFRWSMLNPSRGSYNWAALDNYILDAARMSVVLDSGQIIPKPVGVSIQTYDYIWNAATNQYGVPHMPVGIGGSLLQCTTPSGSGCKRICSPAFATNPNLVLAYEDFVRAMATRYDGNPAFGNLKWISIWTGVDGETPQYKQVQSGCGIPGDSPAWIAWTQAALTVHKRYFVNTVTFIQATLHGTSHWHPYLGTTAGLKLNGMTVDGAGSQVLRNGVLTGGLTGFSTTWHQLTPTGFEPKCSPGVMGYWMLMEYLAAHPWMFDIQRSIIENDIYPMIVKSGFDVLKFTRGHLQARSPAEAPSVWIVFRETKQSPVCWTGSDGVRWCYRGTPGDLEYWLYRVSGTATVVERSELPPKAAAHVYGMFNARRVSTWADFQIDPGFAPGRTSFIARVVYLDSGADTFNIMNTRITKTNSGEWKEVSVLLLGYSFTITSNGDGADIFHRIIVE